MQVVQVCFRPAPAPGSSGTRTRSEGRGQPQEVRVFPWQQKPNLGNRVHASSPKGVAAKKAPDAQIKPFDQASLLNSLVHVNRTSRLKSTHRREQRRNVALVATQHPKHKSLHRGPSPLHADPGHRYSRAPNGPRQARLAAARKLSRNTPYPAPAQPCGIIPQPRKSSPGWWKTV